MDDDVVMSLPATNGTLESSESGRRWLVLSDGMRRVRLELPPDVRSSELGMEVKRFAVQVDRLWRQ